MLLACEQAHLRVARERRRAKRSGVKESGEEVPITSSPRCRVRLHSNVSLDVVSTSHNPKKRWVWHSREGIHVLIMAVNKECFAMNFKPSLCMNMNCFHSCYLCKLGNDLPYSPFRVKFVSRLASLCVTGCTDISSG